MTDIILFTANKDAYAPRRMKEESEKLGIEMESVYYRNLTIETGDKSLGIYSEGSVLPKVKGVFMRGLGEDHEYNPLKYAVVSFFAKQGAKVINSRSFLRWPSLDKSIQHMEMEKSGIPCVATQIFGSKTQALEFYIKNPNFPVIAKDYVGSCGNQVYKLENLDEMENFLKDYDLRKIKTVLFQEFLPGGADVRVIYLDGKILGGMKRIAKEGSYLTNFSQGGDVESFTVTPEIEKIVRETSENFLLDYGGIDLMQDEKGNWKVLEVNRACQFQGFERANTTNVASELVKYLSR